MQIQETYTMRLIIYISTFLNPLFVTAGAFSQQLSFYFPQLRSITGNPFRAFRTAIMKHNVKFAESKQHNKENTSKLKNFSFIIFLFFLSRKKLLLLSDTFVLVFLIFSHPSPQCLLLLCFSRQLCGAAGKK